MHVVMADPEEGHPDVSGASGFIAGTRNDTTNLALAEHAKLERKDLFVGVRQQSDARASIITALGIDSVFTPTELVAQESLARVITPLFWSFVEYAVTQPEEFAERLLMNLTNRCGDVAKDRAIIDLSAAGSPALHRWLLHAELTIGQLLANPDDRDSLGRALQCLHDDTELRQRLSLLSRTAVADLLSMDTMLDQYQALFEDVLGQARHGSTKPLLVPHTQLSN